MGTINKTTAQLNILANGVYGGIHQHDNVVPQEIANGAVYAKLVSWINEDASNGTTPSVANSQITLDTAGTYKVECQLSMGSGTGNTTFFVSAFLDGIENEECHFTRKISVANDIGSASFTGIVVVTAGQVLDLRARHSDASPVNLTIQYGSLNCHLVAL